jgi:hypothetical protein
LIRYICSTVQLSYKLDEQLLCIEIHYRLLEFTSLSNFHISPSYPSYIQNQVVTGCSNSRGGRSLSLRLDISADQGLLEDREQAALGLLALGGANVDEVVDSGGCCGGCRQSQ